MKVFVLFLAAATALVAGCASPDGHNRSVMQLAPVIIQVHSADDVADVLVPTRVDTTWRKPYARSVEKLREGDFDAAIAGLKPLAEARPEEWVLLYTLAVATEAKREDDMAAEGYYEKALTLEGVDSFCCRAGIARIKAREVGKAMARRESN